MNIKQAKRLLEAEGFTVEKKSVNLVLQKFIEMTFREEEENTPVIGDASIQAGTNVIFHANNGDDKKWEGVVSKIEKYKDKTYCTIENAVDDEGRVKDFYNIERDSILELIF